MTKLWIAAIASATFLSACVSTSDITQIGKDSYMVGTSARGGLQSKAEIAALNVKVGTQYCASMGKKFQIDHTESSGVQGWTPVESDITFHCLDESDPSYGRVSQRRDAGSVEIEQK